MKNMKWISVEEDIDPPFNKGLLVIHNGSRSCVIGRLEEIRIKSDGKEFIFRSGASKEWQELKITHWLEIPELPY